MSHRVLLTGANGFIGSHILDQLLKAGHSVRSVVRSAPKADQILADFPNYGTKLDTAIVPDITTPGAFNDAVKSNLPFDTVIHTASPFLYRVIKDNSEFMKPAIQGTVEVLKAVKEFAPEVKRVIITGSCAAVVDFAGDWFASPKKVYTESDWNPTTYEGALAGTTNNAYQASKKFAEKAAWDFLKDHRPNFDLVVLNPPMVYGPLRHTVPTVHDLNESNARIYNLFLNTTSDAPCPPNGMHVYVDVRDLATAHLLAMTVPTAANNRYIICAGEVRSQEIADLIREDVPELRTRTPVGTPGGNLLPETAFGCSSAKAERELGLRFRSKRETFVELARQLVGIEREGK
ncbi:hypothetical protein F5884DRAFT_240895 [Xylogone sp. PMI_703]|nr:hypothetical protein F5884DRAFT_240895 [Xylogone sp. PMI_703]